jgi:cysteine synthase A
MGEEISTRLRVHNDAVHIVAVEPEESAVLSGRPSGSHQIEGIGAGFIVPLWTATLANEVQTISTQEAMATARRLARQEGRAALLTQASPPLTLISHREARS